MDKIYLYVKGPTEVKYQKIFLLFLIICTFFISQSYLPVPKDVRLNCTDCFIIENSKQTRASANQI